MGGDQLRAVRRLHLELREVAQRIDDSERSMPPYWLNVREIAEDRDELAGAYRQKVVDGSAQWTVRNTVIDDGKLRATTGSWLGRDYWVTVHSPGDRLRLSPERVLFTALSAKDLQQASDAIRHGVHQRHVQFTSVGTRVNLYLDPVSHLPTEVETLQCDPYNLAQVAWGDVRFRTVYLFWRREPNGLRYPRQWSTFRNGEPYLDDVVLSLTADDRQSVDEISLPQAAIDAYRGPTALPFTERSVADSPDVMKAIGHDIWLIEGSWNVVVARQADGLIVIEAPQSSRYSESILNLLAHHFPKVPVKAVISTTDALWHFAGLRAYVARGVPAYLRDATLPLARRFVSAPHSLIPDALQRAPRRGVWRPVGERATLGTGDTRMVIYPIRGEGDERMLMVYFPAQHLLYGSSNDLIPDPRTGTTVPTFNLPELVEAVGREGLAVNNYVSIHTELTPWGEVAAAARRTPVTP